MVRLLCMAYGFDFNVSVGERCVNFKMELES